MRAVSDDVDFCRVGNPWSIFPMFYYTLLLFSLAIRSTNAEGFGYILMFGLPR